MSKEDKNNKHITKFLKWIDRYPGWWHLICTPNDEHINPKIIQTIIKQLAKNSFYEIIFVLLMIHRDADFMKDLWQSITVQMLIGEWNLEHKNNFINYLIDYFE